MPNICFINCCITKRISKNEIKVQAVTQISFRLQKVQNFNFDPTWFDGKIIACDPQKWYFLVHWNRKRTPTITGLDVLKNKTFSYLLTSCKNHTALKIKINHLVKIPSEEMVLKDRFHSNWKIIVDLFWVYTI